MIDLILQYGGDIVIVKVNGNSILFGNTSEGAQLSSISGLQLSKKGVEKEFPDLKGNPLWREEAIHRFKQKIKSLKSEQKKADYIISDLRKHGYIPKRIQISGRRIKKLDG